MAKIVTPELSLELDDASGAIVSLMHSQSRFDFMAAAVPSVPFRIHRERDTVTPRFRFRCEPKADQPGRSALGLSWTVGRGVRIDATVKALDGGNEIEFRIRVANSTQRPIVGVEYPVLGNLTAISGGGEDDRLAHAYATGFLVRNPMQAFTTARPGFRYMPYPEGFSGCTAQLLAYYAERGPGFSLSTHDGAFHGKWLNFYKAEDGLLEASVIHAAEAVEPQANIDIRYPTVIRALHDGSWYEAAEHYKSWAIGQGWCTDGPLAGRPNHAKPSDFLDTVGASTFGIDASHDRSRWIERYQETIGTKLHVLGPDWPRMPKGYGDRNGPGGLDDWFPARLDPANMSAIRSHGDLCTPFEFDFLFPSGKAARDSNVRNAYQRFPKDTRSSSRSSRFSTMSTARSGSTGGGRSSRRQAACSSSPSREPISGVGSTK